MSPATAHATTPGATLLEEAWTWLFNLFSVFPPPEDIATAGLTRRVALLIRKWLWSVEGMMRRLIIAAALKVKLDAAAPEPSNPRSSVNRRHRASRAPVFRIFAIHGARPVPHESPALPPRPADARQTGRGSRTSFALDPLLAIGRAGAGRGRPRSRSAPARRVPRRSRWHPLYAGVDITDSLTCVAPSRDRSDCPRPESGLHPSLPVAETRIGRHLLPDFDREEWLKAEAEERTLHPEPGISRRIAALKRLADDPEAAVKRLALRLRGRPGLAGLLGPAVWMAVRKSRTDRTAPPPAQDLIGRICFHVGERLSPPDTS
jgi:hypothetical protein